MMIQQATAMGGSQVPISAPSQADSVSPLCGATRFSLRPVQKENAMGNCGIRFGDLSFFAQMPQVLKASKNLPPMGVSVSVILRPYRQGVLLLCLAGRV